MSWYAIALTVFLPSFAFVAGLISASCGRLNKCAECLELMRRQYEGIECPHCGEVVFRRRTD